MAPAHRRLLGRDRIRAGEPATVNDVAHRTNIQTDQDGSMGEHRMLDLT
jgi:hypothetical protein